MQATTAIPQAQVSPRWYWLGLVVAAMPVVYYFGILGWFAYDMPYMDDYPSLVDFLNKLPTASAGERWRLLLEQNNFHRIVWVKGVAWLMYVLTGAVNFTALQYIGNAALLLMGWLLYLTFSDQQPTERWLFLPALFFLFQFQFWNNTFWAMAAMSNLWTPAWALLAFWLSNRRHEIGALVVGLVALLTVGNGILVLPLLLASFLFRKQVRWAVVTLAVLVPAYGLYFSGYSNPSGVSSASLLTPDRLGHLLALDASFLGAMFYHPAVSWLPMLIGGAIIGWTLYLLITRYDRINPTLFWMLVFLHLTGLMLAVNRIENPVAVVFASRYKNTTALLIAVTYLTVAHVWVRNRFPARRWFGVGSLLVAVGICLVSDITYFSKIVRFREMKQTDQLLWEQYGIIRGCNPMYQPAQQLRKLAIAGMFRPDPLTLANLASRPVPAPVLTPSAHKLRYQIDLQKIDNGFLVVSGFAKIDGQKANFNDTFLAIEGPGGWQFFTTLFHQRLDEEDSLNDKDTGFTAVVPTSSVNPNARMALLVRSGNKTAFQPL